jgi:hypothetical protein
MDLIIAYLPNIGKSMRLSPTKDKGCLAARNIPQKVAFSARKVQTMRRETLQAEIFTKLRALPPSK